MYGIVKLTIPGTVTVRQIDFLLKCWVDEISVFGWANDWTFAGGAAKHAKMFLAILRPMGQGCGAVEIVLTFLVGAKNGKGIPC